MVPFRYRSTRFAADRCVSVGFEENCPRKCVAQAMSGRVAVAAYISDPMMD